MSQQYAKPCCRAAWKDPRTQIIMCYQSIYLAPGNKKIKRTKPVECNTQQDYCRWDEFKIKGGSK